MKLERSVSEKRKEKLTVESSLLLSTRRSVHQICSETIIFHGACTSENGFDNEGSRRFLSKEVLLSNRIFADPKERSGKRLNRENSAKLFSAQNIYCKRVIELRGYTLLREVALLSETQLSRRLSVQL